MQSQGGGDCVYGSTISSESIKVIAESTGVSQFHDDGAKFLSEKVSLILKFIIQDAQRFMRRGKRSRLAMNDIDNALKIRCIEPQYGFVSKDFIPFRFASGGGRELHFAEEKEIDLMDIVTAQLPKLPPDVSIRGHWLAVDGVQPAVPENPPLLSKELQAIDSVNPVIKLEQGLSKDSAGKPVNGKIHKLRNTETVHVKQLATHELSVEQQLYYKEITEACVGSDEPRRGEALQSLASDTGLHEMLPRMCTFIAEGVKVNVVQNNLALLIYLMRMVKALLDNSSLFLEKYLHEIIPSVTTCIVSKQLCMRPELDNHWALRDFASRLMAQICKTFNTSTNNLQTRVTRIFSKALQNDKTHLSSLYGSIAGLAELGGEVIKVFIIPRLKFISERIESLLVGTSQSNTDKTAAGHIRAMLQKCCPPILKQIRNAPDFADEYKNDYGFLGPPLCQAVVKARNSPSASAQPTTVSSNSSNIANAPIITTTVQAASTSVPRPQIVTQRQSSSPIVTTLPQIRAIPSQKVYLVPQSPQPLQQQQQPQQQIQQQTQAIVQQQTQAIVQQHVVHHQQPTTTQSLLLTTNAQNPNNGNSTVNAGIGTASTIIINRADLETVDSNSIIIESEEERIPPELDDLSHLE